MKAVWREIERLDVLTTIARTRSAELGETPGTLELVLVAQAMEDIGRQLAMATGCGTFITVTGGPR